MGDYGVRNRWAQCDSGIVVDVSSLSVVRGQGITPIKKVNMIGGHLQYSISNGKKCRLVKTIKCWFVGEEN